MSKLDNAAFVVFETEMKNRLKPHLLKIWEEKGYEEYFAAIQNCVAGCRYKWKHMTSELKASFLRKAKENTEVEVRLGVNLEKVKGIAIKDSCSPPRSGWDIFREEQHRRVKAEGFSGKEISSQIGIRWRNLSKVDKKRYNRIAKVRVEFSKRSVR